MKTLNYPNKITDLRIRHSFFNSAAILRLVSLFLFTQAVFSQEQYNLSPGKKIIITDATFKKGSAVIEESQRPAFARLAEFLSKRDKLNIEIGGHADNTGTEAQNVDLSLHRAEAVREYLVLSGISPSRIRTRGYGSTEPISDNNDENGRSRNRRVEIIGLSAFSGKLLSDKNGQALQPEARITMLKPTVRVMPAWEGDWKEATINEPLYEAFKVSTLEGAKADITFRNKSVLNVSENAMLMIYGFDASPQLRSQAIANSSSNDAAMRKNIELTKGNLTLKLKEMRASDTFSVRTKVSELGFNTGSQNALAKVVVDERERSIVSVLEGRANVRVLANDPRTGQTLDVGEDFGIIIGDSSAQTQIPQKLPTIPKLIEPEERVIPSDNGIVLFRWENDNLPARLEISSNAEFSDFVYNQIKAKQEAQVNLPEGSYFIRLTSIDSLGFESRSRLRGLVISREIPQNIPEKPFRFRVVEFGLLVVAGGLMWAGLLFNNKRLRIGAIILALIGLLSLVIFY